MRERTPLVVPVFVIAIGLAFIVIGLARPALLWDLGKVRLGREWLGDGGVTALFVIFGAALGAVGLAMLVKR